MLLRSLFLLACFAGIQPPVHAQFKKGDVMAGASLASLFYNSGTLDVSFDDFPGYDGKTSSFGLRIEPAIGLFLSEKAAVGFTLNLNPSGQRESFSVNNTTFQEDNSNSFNLGVGIFARNYFGAGSSWMPFGQLGVNAGFASGSNDGFRYYSGSVPYKETYNGKTTEGFFANASLQFGLTKMLGENAGIDLFLGYNFSRNKNTTRTVTETDLEIDGDIDFTSTNEPTTRFSNHGFILGAGFQVFLRGKKKNK